MACCDDFRELYSIELSSELFELAQRRLASYQKITLLEGNSATELPKILSRLSEPTLFWLDAHYSGEETARADTDTPIANELQAIFRHPVKKHVILIDDARCFNGRSGYPTLDEMKSECPPTWHLSVESDVIILEPQWA
jgi:hypothetical protein